MSKRKSLVVQEYAGRTVGVGEVFEVEPEHVDLLLLLGRITNEEVRPAARPEVKDVVVHEDAVVENNRAFTSTPQEQPALSARERKISRKAMT